MKNNVLQITYASSLTDLCEVNSSFDTGILKVAYIGKNRNNTSISKEAFERAIKTAYNCPIVCNYDRDNDTLGSHDMELVRDEDGGLRVINATNPVGVIPESAKTWFEDVEEDDGTVHTYLFIEALIWKRQEAYKKIKEDGIVAQSMEITIKDSCESNGILAINDFEFTAFCLIGVTPCFEGASLEMFSKENFKQQLYEMMQDLKEEFNMVTTYNKVDDIHPQQNLTEGGTKVLENKIKLAAEYGIDVDTLDFSLEDFSEEELKEKFEAMKAEPDNGDSSNFALTEQIIEELCNALHEIKITTEFGECPQYMYHESDFEKQEVYAWDALDWLMYGFKYETNGDKVIIDFESKKRMKIAIVEFDEGEQDLPFAHAYAKLLDKVTEGSEWENKYNEVLKDYELIKTEVGELRKFKEDTENAAMKAQRLEVIEKFDELTGIEEFELLRENCDNYDVNTLEEKCFAIKGKNSASMKYSLDTKVPVIKISKTEGTIEPEPYGGLFEKYSSNK